MDGLFWLHVKKAAGTTARAALGPLYTQTDRRQTVPDIRSLPRAEWNDALNNYRQPLGPHTFRRCLYARDVLWPGAWDGMVRLAFLRHPVSRAVSMCDYLFDPLKSAATRRAWWQTPRRGPLSRRNPFSRTAVYELFLDALEHQAAYRHGPDPAAPYDLHFATHTAPVHPDVTDEAGRLLLSHPVRLEHFEAGIDLAYAAIGLPRPDGTRALRRHTARRSQAYRPTPAQRARTEALFAADMALYEDALRP